MLFNADGFFARRRSQRRFKLLKGIDAKLREILLPQERVYFLSPGTTMDVAEHFFVGWAAYYLNMRALVFTTERVLLLAIHGRNKPGRLVSQISYANIASVRSTWNGLCKVVLHNRQAFNFQSVAKADRKFIANFLGDIVKQTAAEPGVKTGIEHLCPHCYTVVPGRPAACPVCAGTFRSPRKAALLSLAFPGLGDLYLGHRGFALFEMAGSAFLWFVLVIAPLVAEPDPAFGPPGVEYWVTAAVFIIVAHAIDAAMTRHFALKGHHPLLPGTAAAVAAPPPLRG